MFKRFSRKVNKIKHISAETGKKAIDAVKEPKNKKFLIGAGILGGLITLISLGNKRR